MDSQDHIRDEISRQTVRPPEFREYDGQPSDAEIAEAMASCLRDWTVKQEHLRNVLGDPVASVSAPPAKPQDTVESLTAEAYERGKLDERRRIVGVIEGCKQENKLRFEVVESGHFVPTEALHRISPPDIPPPPNPWIEIAKGLGGKQ